MSSKETTFSVIIAFRGRESHLLNVLKGIESSTLLPNEVVLVNMNSTFEHYTLEGVPCANYHLLTDDKKAIPVGTARNRGALLAKHELLCFLDVDCIPASDYFEIIVNQHQQTKGLLMGTPYYLSHPLSQNWTTDLLEKQSVAHPARRPQVRQVVVPDNYNLFWSLCFTISKTAFMSIGGFDEKYKGYGAEDTDFAKCCKLMGIPFHLSPAKTYHQQHPVHSPPLHAFGEIVENCLIFYEKWNQWPMEEWLKAFADLKLIDWAKDEKTIDVLNWPNKELMQKYYKKNTPYM